MPGPMTDDERERYQQQKARAREAVAADPEKHRDIYRESHRRALYAGISGILERSRDSANPTLGLLGIEFCEDGRYRWMTSGATHPVIALQALEILRVMMTVRAMGEQPAMFGLTRPPFADEGFDGDQPVIADDGTAEIKCGVDDSFEADRERAENAWRLTRAAIAVLTDFYGPHLGVDVLAALGRVDERAKDRLKALAPESFYAGDDPFKELLP